MRKKVNYDSLMAERKAVIHNVAVPEEVHAAVKRHADKSGMKISEIVKRAIAEWLRTHKGTA